MSSHHPIISVIGLLLSFMLLKAGCMDYIVPPHLTTFKNTTLRLPNSKNIVKWTEWTFTFSFFLDFWYDLIPLSSRGPQMLEWCTSSWMMNHFIPHLTFPRPWAWIELNYSEYYFGKIKGPNRELEQPWICTCF